METAPKSMDRRVVRTRQMLRQAFIEVAQEKGMTAVSIQDITERANVHRGTFYAHFPDKYALVYMLIREETHRILTSKLPPVSQWDRWTLQQLIRTVLESFKHVHRQCHPSHILDPLIERAAHEELTELLTAWLKQGNKTHRQVQVETMARLMSWTIFGAAVEWSQETTTRTAEQMARDVLLVITEGIARLAPDVLLE
ncbi:MAG: TetR/AcrR family transcriptional regulator [Ktedonobacteraceae bacterium]|nr:TetR/AcrR family transcriptional regulator [Ktedonobacteraceae bacterium]